MVARFPGAESSKKLRKILLISALDLLGTLAGTTICDKNIWIERESRNLLVSGWWS